ncbi:ATP-dependent Clp protease proteolytic subunit [Rhodospirillum sp. A1_3_36]|uniref:ATP-dependent Clp protease proteolytic subunit n=1 Tax=Rhodospirillum sp. A1_3_36 TaxID=3391666 RepID=UPI0039A4F9D7
MTDPRRPRFDRALSLLRNSGALPALELTLRGEIGRPGGIEADKVTRLLTAHRFPALSLRIDSLGGDLGQAKEIATAIRRKTSSAGVEVLGACHSAALMILSACDYRTARPRSLFTIHNAAFDAKTHPERWTATDLRTRARILEEADEEMAETLARATGGTVATWRDRMGGNLTIDGRQAFVWGLVDEIQED